MLLDIMRLDIIRLDIMRLFYLLCLLILFGFVIIKLHNLSESFIVNDDNADWPNLYPTTGAVDMLGMKSKLIADGYRFQNAMFPPQPINDTDITKVNIYPNNFRLRTGAFKEKAFVEKFVSGGLGSTSQGTMSQLNSHDSQDDYLQAKSRADDTNVEGRTIFRNVAPLDHRQEVNYPNGLFSWGDIIHRFYNPNHYQYSPDVVI